MSKSPNVAPLDYLKTQVLTAASWAAAPFHGTPWNRIVRPKPGEDDTYLPLHWRRYHGHADEIGWVGQDGHADAGRSPRNYGRAVLFNVDRHKLDDLLAEPNREQAVAYRVGTAAMVGYSPAFTLLAREEDASSYEVAMRLGPGRLDASVGAYDPKNYAYYPLEQDALAIADVLPIADLPWSARLV